MSPRLRRLALDLWPAVAIVAGGVLELTLSPEAGQFRGPVAVDAALLAACCAALVFRRRHAAEALTVVFAIEAVWLVALYDSPAQPPIEPFLAGLVACFALGMYTDTRAFWRGIGALVLLGGGTGVVLLARGQDAGNVVPALVYWAAAVGVGRAVRARQRLVELLRERAQSLERDRERELALAAEQERGRIARELHDVIAHAVSVVIVHAAAERRLLEPGAARTAEALATIERTAREAQRELRNLLGVLRTAERDPGLAPQPGLAAVPALVDDGQRVGQRVALEVRGEPRALSRGVDLAAYRIVQEALTNARKHAPAAAVQLTLDWAPSELRIDVVDSGPHGNDRNGGGHGLLGMRERARLYGGHLEARPVGDGFRVAATLPLEPNGRP